MPPAPNHQLFILRHAKSSWDEPGLQDHDRPLAPRGRRAAKLMAAHLRSEDIHPALILCSSARRARETLERTVPVPAEVQIDRGLYGATADELIERLRHVPATTRSVMVIGHNPALHALAWTLAAPSPTGRAAGLDALREKFPTGALATLTMTCSWHGLGRGCAELTGFVRPGI
ncbi:MAG TPA: histidine phosphatase family protein [Solirubrobacteraceae bacterium]|jgi:phosphohistidine phosphatase